MTQTSQSVLPKTAQRNLGTYSNIIESPGLQDILVQAISTNFVDKAAYPGLARMERATVRFLSDLVHGDSQSFGVATTGSSEAIMLALAWHQRNFLDKSPNRKPNFVVNEGYHKSFEKYARLFGAELRSVPVGADMRVDCTAIERAIDKSTFCIVGIACSTELGFKDDIQTIDKIASQHNIPVHIDAAIGGYVLPFVRNTAPWDFRLPSIQTMNISAHKYGLCLPGIGFLLARGSNVIPDNYNGDIAYLSGGGVADHALSCTRNGAFVAQAYHNSLHYGLAGYRDVTRQNLTNAHYLAKSLQQISGVEDVVIGDAPVVNINSRDTADLSSYLSMRGWVQSSHFIRQLGQNYIRIVVRKHISTEMVDDLLGDIRKFYSR